MLIDARRDNSWTISYKGVRADNGQYDFQWLSASEAADMSGYSFRSVRRLCRTLLADSGLAVLKANRWWVHPAGVSALKERRQS